MRLDNYITLRILGNRLYGAPKAVHKGRRLVPVTRVDLFLRLHIQTADRIDVFHL